jgi:hypothetical protein
MKGIEYHPKFNVEVKKKRVCIFQTLIYEESRPCQNPPKTGSMAQGGQALEGIKGRFIGGLWGGL